MAGEELGPWDPLGLDEAAAEFGMWKLPWWIAGGWAIDLHLGHQSREHGDLDVLVLRRDQALVREHLTDWMSRPPIRREAFDHGRSARHSRRPSTTSGAAARRCRLGRSS